MSSEIYVVVCDGAEWEDIAIFPDLSDAKLSLLRSYWNCKKEPLGLWIEKFTKSDTDVSYAPAYEKIVLNYDRVRDVPFSDDTYIQEDWFVSHTY